MRNNDLSAAGAALTAASSLAAMAPPPAGPVIATALQVVGGLLPMFAGDPPPSAELQAINKIDAKLDTVINN